MPKRDYDTPFSRQLRVWMAAENVTANDLAAAVGVEPMTVYRWRSGVNAPVPEWWDAIAEALRIDRAEIARLLLGVDLLPPDVQAFAEVLAKLPAKRRLEIVRQVDNLIQGEGREHIEHKVVCAQVVAG